jgi:hypothetical protein
LGKSGNRRAGSNTREHHTTREFRERRERLYGEKWRDRRELGTGFKNISGEKGPLVLVSKLPHELNRRERRRRQFGSKSQSDSRSPVRRRSKSRSPVRRRSRSRSPVRRRSPSSSSSSSPSRSHSRSRSRDKKYRKRSTSRGRR